MDMVESIISLSQGMSTARANAQREVSLIKKAMDIGKNNVETLLETLNQQQTGSNAAKAMGLGQNIDLFV